MKKKVKHSKKITRKAAIKKVGVTALTASSLLFLSAQDGPVASTNTISVTKPGRDADGEIARTQRH